MSETTQHSVEEHATGAISGNHMTEAITGGRMTEAITGGRMTEAISGNLMTEAIVGEADPPWTLHRACAEGRDDIVQNIVDRGEIPGDLTGCGWIAAMNGHLRVLEFLYERHLLPERNLSYAHAAARAGHLHVLRWLREKRYPWDVRVLALAAKHRHVPTLLWAKENGCPSNEWLFLDPAREADVAAMELLWKDAGCRRIDGTDVAREAATGGHVRVLEWLTGIAVPFDPGIALARAAACGREAILMHNGLLEHWTPLLYAVAARNLQHRCLDVLYENGCAFWEWPYSDLPPDTATWSPDIRRWFSERGFDLWLLESFFAKRKNSDPSETPPKLDTAPAARLRVPSPPHPADYAAEDAVTAWSRHRYTETMLLTEIGATEQAQESVREDWDERLNFIGRTLYDPLGQASKEKGV